MDLGREAPHPTVSVILPVYDSMPYVTATLESVLGQDLRSIEVIAVDDGSTDGSGEELDRFAEQDPRLTVVHQANSGWPGMPRNRGLERASGEFVFFMDSDDTMAPHALSALVAMAEERDADVVIPRFQGVGGRGVQSLFKLHPEGEISLERAMETLSPQKLFRRSLIEQHALRFPEGRVRLEDGIFVTAAYVRARLILFCGADPLYFIAKRDDEKNISSSPIQPENYVGSCRRIAATLLAEVPDPERARRLVQQLFARKGLRFYAPQRWQRMTDDRKAEWVAQHRAFLDELVAPERDAAMGNPTNAQLCRLIRAGDLEGIDTLVDAQADLAHESVCLGLEAVPGGVEVMVEVIPNAEERLLSGASKPGPARVAAAERLHRLLRPTLRWRVGRGVTRRAESFLAGGGIRVYLHLSGRRVGRGISVPGRRFRVAGRPDALAYRFVLPLELMRRFARDRVDLWTILEVRGSLSGRRARVAAADGQPSKAAGMRLYATEHGNASLDLRAPARAPRGAGPRA